MGDRVPGPRVLEGKRFQVSYLSDSEAAAWAARCGEQFEEEQWLSVRLKEAVEAWQPLVGPTLVVVLREVLGESMSDGDVAASLDRVPSWLQAFTRSAIPPADWNR